MHAKLEQHGVDYGTTSWETVRKVENIVEGAIDDILRIGIDLQYIIGRVNARMKLIESGSQDERLQMWGRVHRRRPADAASDIPETIAGPWLLVGR